MTTRAEAFEDACVDTNTAAQLAQALKEGPGSCNGQSDRKQWGITRYEWVEAIKNALASKTADE